MPHPTLKYTLYYHCNPVLGMRFWQDKTGLESLSIFTLEKPKKKEENNKERNFSRYYAEKQDKHYIILREDRDVYRNDSDVSITEVVAVCHRIDHANYRVLKESKIHAIELAKALKTKEFLTKKGECKNLERVLRGIKIKV